MKRVPCKEIYSYILYGMEYFFFTPTRARGKIYLSTSTCGLQFDKLGTTWVILYVTQVILILTTLKNYNFLIVTPIFVRTAIFHPSITSCASPLQIMHHHNPTKTKSQSKSKLKSSQNLPKYQEMMRRNGGVSGRLLILLDRPHY